MTKSLAQITFDFASVDGEAGSPADAVPVSAGLAITGKKEKVLIAEASAVQTAAAKPSVVAGKRGRKSLKDAAPDADLLRVPEDEILFKKQYYAIGEVAIMFGENQSLIRYWETEFDILQPRKNRKGDRFFRPVDIKNLVLIYDLLRRRKFTIEGAKEYLKKNNAKHPAGRAEEKFALIQSLEKIKGFLLELKANL